MAKLTFTQLIGEVGALIGITPASGSEEETSIKWAINAAGRRIWTSRPWPERFVETTITTVAPYSTGTADFTNASASVTGSGTTWTGFAGRKMALGLNAPWYRISTIGGVTSITLARVYQETTVTGSTYTIYQDEYDTLSTADSIVSAHLLYNNSYGPLHIAPEGELDADAMVQLTTGRPTVVALTRETTSGTKRLRVTPVPDSVYAIVVKYLKSYTALSGGSDTSGLNENQEWLLVQGALLYAQRIPNARQLTGEAEFEALLARAWKDAAPIAPMTAQRRTFDRAEVSPITYFRVT